MRAYYSNYIDDFIKQSSDEILGIIAQNNEFPLEENQKKAWLAQIRILKELFIDFDEGYIIFEYTIPRMGKRIDNILIYKGIIYLLEFKIGERNFSIEDRDQVYDYALDLKNFHEDSHEEILVPILISTEAKCIKNEKIMNPDGIMEPIFCNKNNLLEIIEGISKEIGKRTIDPKKWMNSRYRPTPTIIEAAQALYKGHNVKEISRSDSGAKNLNETTDYINNIIDFSKANKRKSICFLTGVPGAGKTLAGLNIGNSRQKYEEEEHAVFLSGNGPLVKVLRESLARDDHETTGALLKDARRKANLFIQNIHHFRDDTLQTNKAPIEKVVIFDEAQRAWNKTKTVSFMKDKYPNFDQSEPDYLISVMDRHDDWAVIVCLIGGGQEIHTGEAGLREWFYSLDNYSDWDVYLSDRISDDEYLKLNSLDEIKLSGNYELSDKLHLSTSLRSFRSENLSNLIRNMLDLDIEASKFNYEDLKSSYPIKITRNIDTAKKWLELKARGTERYGLICSSGAKRLRPLGINVYNQPKEIHWFLGGKEDVRSSFYLEEVATEFDIQGLELDWACVAWGADFRLIENDWIYRNFVGTKWQKVHKESERLYKKNTYRVLLTRARQGMVIFVPKGDELDYTRIPEYYNGIFKYLKEIGIEELDDEQIDKEYKLLKKRYKKRMKF